MHGEVFFPPFDKLKFVFLQNFSSNFSFFLHSKGELADAETLHRISFSSINMFSITTLFSTLTIDKEFLHLVSRCLRSVHLIIDDSPCARSRNFSSSPPACSPSSFVVRRDESPGSWDDSSRFVASTRTSDRKFHVDSLRELAGESVGKEKK